MQLNAETQTASADAEHTVETPSDHSWRQN